MLNLSVHKDYQKVRHLPFCYLCGRDFIEGDETDGDHVPPRAVFNVRDRNPMLVLKAHKACNVALSVYDKKIGQLIALRRRERPKSARDYALQLGHYPSLGVAVENINVDAAVWRWVKGFHAALYRQPLIGNRYAIQTPFPRADMRDGAVEVRPILKQHVLAVDTIKTNRAYRNLDTLTANKGHLRYECVWCQADDKARWFCMFALDIYDWKDLGSHTKEIPARGCVGTYALPDYSIPNNATQNRAGPIIIPNISTLDPFAP